MIENEGKTRVSIKYNPKKEPCKTLEDGFEVYTSDTMTFSMRGVHGYLKKRIDSAVSIHFEAYHTRYVEIDFKKGLIVFKKQRQDSEGRELSL